MSGRPVVRVASAPSVGGHRDDRPATLCARDVVVDLDARLVVVGGRVLIVPRKELDILAVLVGAAGRIVARQELIDQVWEHHQAPAKSLDVHIRRLRRRIEPDPHRPRYIRTVRGFGYVFDTVPVPPPAPGPGVGSGAPPPRLPAPPPTTAHSDRHAPAPARRSAPNHRPTRRAAGRPDDTA